MKRNTYYVISFFVIVALFLIPSVSASADMIYSIELAQEITASELNIKVPVVLTSDGAVSALQFDILYDKTQLEYQDAEAGSLISGFNMTVGKTEGKLRVIIYNIVGKKIPFGSVPILYLNFKRLGNEGSLSICNTVISDTSANNLSYKYTAVNRTLRQANSTEINAQALNIVTDDATEQQEVISLKNEAKIKAQATIDNPNLSKHKVIIFFALYDGNGKLLMSKTAEANIEQKSALIEVKMTLPNNMSNCTLKASVWDINSLNHLCDNLTLYSQ